MAFDPRNLGVLAYASGFSLWQYRSTTDTAATREARTELPATASLLPLLAIIGVGSLVGSRMLRRGRV